MNRFRCPWTWAAAFVAALLLPAFLSLPAESTPANKTLQQWVTDASVGKPVVYKNVALYPVMLSHGNVPGALTLDEAIKAGSLKVSEVSESGSVNSLVLENKGKRPVFIMAGEILSGAKQDRVLQHALWLEPGAGEVDVGAFCVEQGRWSYQGSTPQQFQTKATLSNLSVRAEARGAKSQGAVWSKVQETQDNLGYDAPTRSLNAAYEDSRVQADVSGYMNALQGMLKNNPKMNGVVVQIGDKVLAVDCFSRRDSLERLWSKMVKSYALEATSRGGASADANTDQARRFLLKAASADPTRMPNPGGGALLELTSQGVTGEALVLDSGVVHLELFPRGASGSDVVPIQRQYR